MITSRTPYRISFFGGGTDYPSWYLEEGGSVLSTTIDQCLYISCRELPPFFETRHKIIWSRAENVHRIDEINHPAIREGLKYLGFDDSVGLEIHYQGDLPGKSGMGSSSAFVVGLINALSGFKGIVKSRYELAQEAIELEQTVLKEAVGVQDQFAAAYGGVNRIDFAPDGTISVRPMPVRNQRLSELESHLMLVFTGLTRFSFEVAEAVIEEIPNRKKELRRLHAMVDEASDLLGGDGSLEDFGRLLGEGWSTKKRLSSGVSNATIDAIYDAAMDAGAIGGKLLGAGGGGFMLVFAHPDRHQALRETFRNQIVLPVRFSHFGSQLIEL